MTQGNSNEITIAIGYDNVSNIDGLVQKNNTNNYILKLNWTPVTNPSNETSVIYIISYLDKIYQTSESNFNLPITYGTQIFNENTGRINTLEQCVTIEARFIYDGGYYSSNIEEFCFCPPVDLFCKKTIKTTKTQKSHEKKSSINSSKMRYANSLKNSNGALGLNFNLNNCASPNYWNSLQFKVGKNDCYKKNETIILPEAVKSNRVMNRRYKR